MSESREVVKCNSKEEYITHVKKCITDLVEKTQLEKEVFGALVVIDLGDTVSIQQVGNQPTLDNLRNHMRGSVAKRGSASNAIGAILVIFGLGMLFGMFLH